MHGNVAEWTLDMYKKDWYAQFAGKTVKAADIVNWPGGKSQYPRVIRGGGWESEAEQCRSSARSQSKAAMNVKDPQLPKSPHWMTEGFWIGFRVVSPAKEPSEAEKLKDWNADDDMTKRVITRDRERYELISPPEAGAAAR